jgi:hypothetical protein
MKKRSKSVFVASQEALIHGGTAMNVKAEIKTREMRHDFHVDKTSAFEINQYE